MSCSTPHPSSRELREFRQWSRQMLEHCRELKVGDEIRFVQMPSFADKFHRMTRRQYRRLIARKRPTRIAWIDDGGVPWIEYRFNGRNGRWEEYHSLAVNVDSWVKVKKRRVSSN